jgi:hypothetical protein
MPRHLLPASLAAGLILLAGCSSGPSTEAELCAGYDELNSELINSAGFANEVFDAAGDLADVADRYPGTELYGEPEALQQIADSDETDANELRNATINISTACGRPPLGIGGF